MVDRFNAPPGWPIPPEGWRPDAGWTPDPSWPPAPQGWQFWVADTRQVHPSQQFQEPPGQGASWGPERRAPQSRSTGLVLGLIGAAVLGVAVVGWWVGNLADGREPDPSAATTSPAATAVPTDTEAPSTDSSTGSEDPTPDIEVLNSDAVLILNRDEPAIVGSDEPVDGQLVPVAEVRLLEVVSYWQPTEPDGVLTCDDPAHGQFLGLQVEVTVLPDASAPVAVSGLGWYPGANGTIVEDNSATWSPTLSCVALQDALPAEMVAGQTYTGWLAMDAPEDVTEVIYAGFSDQDHAWFIWQLADF